MFPRWYARVCVVVSVLRVRMKYIIIIITGIVPNGTEMCSLTVIFEWIIGD